MERNSYSIHEEDVEGAIERFERLDHDDDGYVDVSEFRSLLDMLKKGEVTQSEARDVFERIDKDDDGRISREEFVSWWTP